MQDKQWKDVPGYEGLYQASNLGLIRSKPRQGTPGKVLKYRKIIGRKSKNPIKEYFSYAVVLYKNNQPKSYFIHRLILTTFIGQCPAGMECRHLDGDSMNNKLNNLQWATPQDNYKDKIKHGTVYNGNQRGSHNPRAILNEDIVIMIKKHIKDKILTNRAIAKKFNISEQTVCDIKKGRNWGWLNE